MSYYRLYPNKNNTIFRYLGNKSTDINCGANPVMELLDGKGESKLLFAFELPQFLKGKLSAFNYTTNLQLWDAGTLFEPAIQLKNVKLESFNENFVEGDGYSFLHPENRKGVSNWVYRDSANKWEDVVFTEVSQYHLDRINEDLNFNVTSTIQDFITADITPKFALSIENRTDDAVNIYRKFIHSRHTRTVFRPYLEFFIEDELLDSTYNFYAKQENKVYLINQRGKDFTDVVTATITVDNTTNTVAATKERMGVYYVTITPDTLPSPMSKTICSIIWSIGGVAQQKLNNEVKNPNELVERFDQDHLFFYAVTSSTHNVTKHGDVLPFNVVSEIRGKGVIVLDNYEYRITSMDGFEMIPWTKCSIYRDKIYFNVYTDYFFPENQYEVFVRYKTDDVAVTSTLTHKFKVAMSDKSHLRELSASPYYSREQFFSK